MPPQGQHPISGDQLRHSPDEFFHASTVRGAAQAHGMKIALML